MSNFSNRLTNGIYLPPLRMCSDDDDICLESLGNYLKTFIIDGNEELMDVRNKIKTDFDLLNKFEKDKQSQVFNKILKRTVEESSQSALQNIGVQGQRDHVQRISK